MKPTTILRASLAIMILLCLMLPFLTTEAEESRFSIADAQQQTPRDTQRPTITLTSPVRGSSHNVFPAISGTAEDKEQPTGTPNETIPPSGVARVLVVIYSYANGKYWNGVGWVTTDDPIKFALPASLSGANWTLSTGLPEGDNLNLDKYLVAVIAFDNANNRGDEYTEFSIDRFFITFWDANEAFADQQDFSDDHPMITDDSLARLAARLYNLRYSYPWSDPATGHRGAAVADGTTKLLVMVEGHTPGPLTLRRKFEGIKPIGEDALKQINADAAPEDIYPIASIGDHWFVDSF